MNPVNDYLEPIFEDIFAPLVRDGYLAFVCGGGDVGEYLTHHDAVQAIHITGSAQTHDLIVYGPGQDGQRRKAARDRDIDKPITSELGGVGGTIVLPGPWTEADFRYQAQHVVTQKLHNSGHNCVASQVLILPADWDGSQTVLGYVRRQLDQAEARTADYPGTEQRLAALQDARLTPRYSAAAARAAARPRVPTCPGPLRVPDRVLRPRHGHHVAARKTPGVPPPGRRLLQRPALRHAVGQHHRPPSDPRAARRRLRPRDRRPALRRDRDQRVGRRRLPAPPRRLGRLPRAHQAPTSNPAPASCTTR